MNVFKSCVGVFLFLFCAQPLLAQRGVYKALSREHFENIPTVNIAKAVPAPTSIRANLEHATYFIPQKAVMDNILTKKPSLLSLEIQADFRDEPFVLLLKKVQTLTPDFICKTSSGKVYTLKDLPANVQYMGVIRGLESESLVAVSFSDGQICGVLSDLKNGNMTIGKLDGEATHIIYPEKSNHSIPKSSTPPVPCVQGEPTQPQLKQNYTSVLDERAGEKCVRQYVEVHNNIYKYFNQDFNQTVNFAIGLFNVSSILFFNDGLDVIMSEVLVWDQMKYQGPNYYGQFIDAIANTGGVFNGDIAHLIVIMETPTGQATNVYGNFCAQKDSAACYSGIVPSYLQLPAFSVSAKLITHETGHVLGAHHSFECFWNNTGTAMDSCGGSICYYGPFMPPGSNLGTIMSYCDRTSVGVNLLNGFGDGPGQPAELLRNIIGNSECLTRCCIHTWNSYEETLTDPITQAEMHAASTTVTGLNEVSHKEGTVLYRAHQTVTLENGFHTELSRSAVFIADIGSCDPISISEKTKKMFNAETPYINAVNGIRLYPNPANADITLQSDDELKQIQIYDISSKIVLEQNGLHTKKTTLNIKALSSGIYYLKVVSTRGYMSSFKLSKL